MVLFHCEVSVAVVECAGALAERHPAAFITKLIPTLKKEMFSGEQTEGRLKRLIDY